MVWISWYCCESHVDIRFVIHEHQGGKVACVEPSVELASSQSLYIYACTFMHICFAAILAQRVCHPTPRISVWQQLHGEEALQETEKEARTAAKPAPAAAGVQNPFMMAPFMMPQMMQPAPAAPAAETASSDSEDSSDSNDSSACRSSGSISTHHDRHSLSIPVPVPIPSP